MMCYPFGCEEPNQRVHPLIDSRAKSAAFWISAAGRLDTNFAPEQLEGKDAEARTYIFAFGAVVERPPLMSLPCSPADGRLCGVRKSVRTAIAPRQI
jgi:hypothetical protein